MPPIRSCATEGSGSVPAFPRGKNHVANRSSRPVSPLLRLLRRRLRALCQNHRPLAVFLEETGKFPGRIQSRLQACIDRAFCLNPGLW
jgi:hypothetical protein